MIGSGGPGTSPRAEKRPSDGKGAKNGGHGSHKATKDAQGGNAAK